MKNDASNPNAPAIEINNLIRRYGTNDAVNGLSLRVAPGRCYGFFGRNGAGKTTTIKRPPHQRSTGTSASLYSVCGRDYHG